MNKIIFLILFLIFGFASLNIQAEAFDLILDFDKVKAKMPFKKKAVRQARLPPADPCSPGRRCDRS